MLAVAKDIQVISGILLISNVLKGVDPGSNFKWPANKSQPDLATYHPLDLL